VYYFVLYYIGQRHTYKYGKYIFNLLENTRSVNIIFTIDYLCEGGEIYLPTYIYIL